MELTRIDEGFDSDGAFIHFVGSVPKGNVTLPAVLLIPDVYGVTDHVRKVVDRFSQEGYAAFALDLFSRSGGVGRISSMDDEQKIFSQMKDEEVISDIVGMIEHIKNRPNIDGKRIALVGFSVGGTYALMVACQCEDIRGVVDYYGPIRYRRVSMRKPKSPIDLFDDLKCPILGLFGEKDSRVPLDDVRLLADRLKRSGKAFGVRVFPEAGHGFFNDTIPEMVQEKASQESWTLILSFLDQWIG